MWRRPPGSLPCFAEAPSEAEGEVEGSKPEPALSERSQPMGRSPAQKSYRRVIGEAHLRC
jgi:hypothetical protein